MTVLQGEQQIKIRLHGIDAPEKKQPFGTQAKKFASDLAFGKTVQIIGSNKDRYGRLLATVILPDGRHLNEEIVYAGFAWWYRQYAPHDEVLKGLESDARQFRRGLWTDDKPIPPWEWRGLKKAPAVR
jgi:micrococcal nuclease